MEDNSKSKMEDMDYSFNSENVMGEDHPSSMTFGDKEAQ